MPIEKQDANNEQASSASSGTGHSGGQAQETDDLATDGPRNPQLLEVAQRAYEQSTRNQTDQTNNEQEASGPQSGQDGAQEQADPAQGQQGQQQGSEQNQNQQNQQGKETVAKPGDQQQAQAKPQEQEVPFHNHPRWQEMLQQRDTLEQRASAAEQRLQSLKPIEEQSQFHRSYMERFGISDQDVANAMEFLAMQRTNPQRALEMLKPIQQSLAAYDPNVLPPDIQALVDKDEMTPAAAKMLAQSRAELNAFKQRQQSEQANAQVAANRATSNAISSWDMAKRGQDPDYKPKRGENDPDGLWELTAKSFAYIQTTNFAQSPAQATANLEKAYKEAKAMVMRLASARQPIRNPVTSSRSSNASVKTKPKNVYDVTKEAVAKYGINYTPPSGEDEE
jgi:hypothetical protein